jgi:Polymer-forming cytoskeletal
MTVQGRVEGALDVATTLRVTETGRVRGAVRATHLVAEPGARVRARCRVGLPAAEPAEERAPALRLTPRQPMRVVKAGDSDASSAAGA